MKHKLYTCKISLSPRKYPEQVGDYPDIYVLAFNTKHAIYKIHKAQ